MSAVHTPKMIALIVLVCSAVPVLQAATIDEVLDKMEENENAVTSRAEVTQIVTKAGGRETVSRLNMWSADTGKLSLMEYIAPARIKGMKILMRNDGDDIWFYSPRTSRVRKIASHQKNQSINNSDFSYEDMSTSDFRKDYRCTLHGREKIDGQECYRIEMRPRKEESSYSKIVFWARTDNYVGIRGEYYDEDGELWKNLFMHDVEKHGPYYTAKKIVMENVQKQSSTVMQMDKVEYDIDLDESLFSERALKR